MERNLLRRIETCWPLLDPEVAAQVRSEALDAYLADDRRAWLLQADGSYLPPKGEGEATYSAQDDLLLKHGG